jgi:hypothetical protein
MLFKVLLWNCHAKDVMFHATCLCWQTGATAATPLNQKLVTKTVFRAAFPQLLSKRTLYLRKQLDIVRKKINL